jgi:hypothetical protein
LGKSRDEPIVQYRTAGDATMENWSRRAAKALQEFGDVGQRYFGIAVQVATRPRLKGWAEESEHFREVVEDHPTVGVDVSDDAIKDQGPGRDNGTAPKLCKGLTALDERRSRRADSRSEGVAGERRDDRPGDLEVEDGRIDARLKQSRIVRGKRPRSRDHHVHLIIAVLVEDRKDRCGEVPGRVAIDGQQGVSCSTRDDVDPTPAPRADTRSRRADRQLGDQVAVEVAQVGDGPPEEILGAR